VPRGNPECDLSGEIAMSRSGSVSALLGDPELRVRAVAASGDCFYEAVGGDAFARLKKYIIFF
jgi:hypothetical protein